MLPWIEQRGPGHWCPGRREYKPAGDSDGVNSVAYDVKNPNVFAAYTPALQDPAVNFKCFVVRGTGISYPALKRAVEALGRENVGEMFSS